MQKFDVLNKIREGKSNRQIERETGIDRKTVAKYKEKYKKQLEELEEGGDIRRIQEEIVSGPKYDSSNRKPVKYTKEMDEMLDTILAGEIAKDRVLGIHKQKLTNKDIHKLVVDAGHDIGLSTISLHINEKRAKARKAFIRQAYDLGDRIEYDFGEVKLVIAGVSRTLHMAVFGAPASSFRWAYLYENQKKAVFMDSHVRFYENIGGVYKENVYDNMKNVVSKFIGRNEKELNEDLVKMSLYYEFKINVTNCYSGNEKGYVESSVKVVRKQAFSGRYKFESIDAAEAYLHEKLHEMNKESRIEDEKQALLPYKPPLELAVLTKQVVDKYSFVRVENNFYSVPEHLVGRKVTIKNYLKDIIVYANSGKVCEHKKADGFGEMQVDIYHYLDTLAKKPGALRNSKALKSKTELKTIYDMYFTKRTKEFIDILRENQEESYEDMLEIMHKLGKTETVYRNKDDVTIEDHISERAKDSLKELSQMFLSGGDEYVN